MKATTQEPRDHRFAIGLLAGTAIGAGLAIWLAPMVGDAISGLVNKGQDVRDDLADAVARGAHEVERQATAAKSDRTPDVKKHATANRSASL